VAGGFLNVVPPLGLSGAGTQAGFITPIPFLGMGGTAGEAQGGFISPLPFLGMGGSAIVQGQSDYQTKRVYFTQRGRLR